MEQLVENMDVVINERRDYITQMAASEQAEAAEERVAERPHRGESFAQRDGRRPVAGRGGSCAFSGDGERVREEGR